MTSPNTSEETLDAVAARDDIDSAYPTQRCDDNRTEATPGARAPGPVPPQGTR